MKKLPFTKSIPIAIAIGLLFVSCSQNDDPMPTVPVVTETEEANPYAMSIDEAQEMLEQILAKEEASTRSSSRTIKNRFTLGDGNRTRSAAADEHPTVHVFNFDDNGGFAIMSADKRTSPLLALTENGELKPEMHTDNLGFIFALEQAEAVYKAQIEEAEANDYGETRSIISSTTENGVTTIVNLDSVVYYPKNKSRFYTHWRQDTPYNKYCPKINGVAPKAGCVPVAIAQLMAYHKYPSSYAGYTYNWNDMINDLDDDAVAVLLSQIGAAVHVNYGIDFSGAQFEDVPATLQQFGYHYPGMGIEFNFPLIWQQVSSGYPVLMCGYCTQYRYVYNPFGILIYCDTQNLGHLWLASSGRINYETVTKVNVQNNELISSEQKATYYVYYNYGWGYDENSDDNYDGFIIGGYPDTKESIQNFIDPYGNHHSYTTDNNYYINCSALISIIP